ncbi:unnamed protein product [Polarella glacialis]|uniref:Uncharacterized protein n=2 Tax=Polarella glacialis TaxID=89957 RepID=A0A813FC19_POLGL|nr:unnamed protein product [Polarella glacialis]
MPGGTAGGENAPDSHVTAALDMDLEPLGVGDAEDPDQVISFLCQKFSGLIDRVRQAETKQVEAQRKVATLAPCLQEAVKRRQSSSSTLQAALRTHRAEAANAQQRLFAARSAADFASSELRQAREVAGGLNERCEELTRRCREEQRSAQDVEGLVTREDEAWAASEREREGLRRDMQAASSKLVAQEEELVIGHERDRHRRADLRALEERLQEAGRCRQVAERRARTGQEEVAGALKQVALFQDKLETIRNRVQQRQEDLQQEACQLEDLYAENLQDEQEAASARDSLDKLGQLKVKLEGALRAHVEAHNEQKAATLVTRGQKEANSALDIRQQEISERIGSVNEELATAGADQGRWQLRLQALGDSLRQLRASRDSLEESSRGAGNVGLSLQGELQHTFADTEKLRAERDEALAAGEELQRRLRAAEPALETTRRRARELEESLEDISAELHRARSRKESLLREVGHCREKMRGLRNRHSALSEKAHTLEKRFVRSSGSFGGTAGFAAAAASTV